MAYFFIIPSYLAWHYGRAFSDILRIWTNFLWFLSNFFSLSLLVRTIFAPWRRIHDEKTKGKFDPEEIAEKIVSNIAMRIVGFVMRIFALAFGILVILLAFWGGMLFYIAWILMPILVPASFFFGLSNIFGL